MSKSRELTKDYMNEKVEDARDVSNRLSQLREKKRDRLESDLESDTEPSDGVSVVDGVVSDVETNDSMLSNDTVEIDVTYICDGEGCVKSFKFDVPSNNSELGPQNDLLRFIHYVGDGDTTELEKTLHRDVPLYISKDGQTVELGIPSYLGVAGSIQSTLDRISTELFDMRLSDTSRYLKSVLTATSGASLLTVGLLGTLPFSGFVSVEPFVWVFGHLLFGSITSLTLIPVVGVSYFAGMLVSELRNRGGVDVGVVVGVLSIVAFTLSMLTILNGATVGSDGALDIMSWSGVKFSGVWLSMVLGSGMLFKLRESLSVGSYIGAIRNWYQKTKRRIQLLRGPEYVDD